MAKGIEAREVHQMDLLFEVDEVISILGSIDAHITIELLERIVALPKKSKKRVELEMDQKRQARAFRIMENNLKKYFIENKRRKND